VGGRHEQLRLGLHVLLEGGGEGCGHSRHACVHVKREGGREGGGCVGLSEVGRRGAEGQRQ
jgi:hypothetical protein